ncbi:DUF2164 domain-containing protein [Mesobacillus maritimus]|uniref:DUF2164 domain-containing protein n=1 Tax=Mesobacillus maritimus TaxID=1643336 RepID=A0ABS7K476_9BACI|nr:DUF2164 domain-containing protein [Mesobacillus maritimus]MBY0097062.1 DUF2164 domain-containing protein [Mesobacillus maritimus]
MSAKMFELPKSTKEEMAAAIQTYFMEERGEELGDLAAVLMLDFITEKLGPTFYNLGVQDSYRFMSQKLEDLFEIEKK